MAKDDVREVDLQEGEAKPKRRFDARDWKYIAEHVRDERETRKKNRSDREKQWKEIDRQVAMEPDTSFKYIIKDGKRVLDRDKAWMAEMELPLQAQALEVLTADARRMMIPDSGPFFRAHAETTDKYFNRVDFSSIILGDEAEVPSKFNQDNADKLVEGFVLHQMRQYDFPGRLDRINAESFKYGMGIARGRRETKNVYIHEARGVRKETQRIPVLVPVSVKNCYLDNPMPSVHSAHVLGPAVIWEDWIKHENLIIAASKGSNNPEDEDGGWMPDALKGLEPDENGNIQLLEMEGDIVVPRKTVRSFVIPGAIVTVAVGGKDKGGTVTNGVVRFRYRKTPWSSYLLFPYHYECVDDAYPTSPLMKGRPIQIMAVDALNRSMDAAALKNRPPVQYDRNDTWFAQQGGPTIFPGALWGSMDPVKVMSEVGGEPAALAQLMTLAINLYAEMTGVLPGRLGAQTVSHTTAFAKGAELQRGAVRTVDYVSQCSHGPLARWLEMSYAMGRESIERSVSFYIEAYGGFVEITKDYLPERTIFEWFGAGGPAEEAQKQQNKLNSLALALRMDQVGQQMGLPPSVDLQAAISAVLREGGWPDLDAIMAAAQQASAQPITPNPGLATTALQQLIPAA